MAARFPRFHVGVTPFKGCKCAEKVFQSAYRRGCDLRFRQRRGPDSAVSIHAPAWGATLLLSYINYRLDVFQSTHPRGVRHWVTEVYQKSLHVSIHAPAWGATAELRGMNDGLREFQSTHPRGVRQGLQEIHNGE